MALLKIGEAVVRHPDLAPDILPDQDLEGKVDRDAGSGQHQRGAGLWVAKDQELGRRHCHADASRFSAVVHERE